MRTIPAHRLEGRAKIAQRVLAARLDARMSQAGSARAAGLSRFSWIHYEKGEVSIPSEVLPRIAFVLGCTTNRLLGVAETVREAA